MRVLFLADDYPPAVGGIQTFAAALPAAVAAEGHQVAVVARSGRGAGELDARASYPVLRCPARSKAGAVARFRRACLVAPEALGGPPDWVVATKWFPEGPAALLAGGSAPVALIAHGREFLPQDSRWLKRPVQRWVLRRAGVALANSEYTAANLRLAGVPPQRIRVIYCGVEALRYQVPREQVEKLRGDLRLRGKRVLLTAGRLVARKGHDVVLRALPQVLASSGEVHYLVVGDGPERARLVALAAELGVAAHVSFLGRLSDELMPAHFAVCDAFVMPSRDIPGQPIEGFGIAYLEAAAAGKPAVAGRSGGAPEAVLDGVTGLVVDPQSPAEVATAVTRLLQDASLATGLGRAARERVEREFTWARVAERFLAALAAHPSA